MSLPEALLAENRDVEQLRSFIDGVTSEVAAGLQAKFDNQEELVEAFGDDETAVGLVAAKTKLDKAEERLIAAKLRLDGAYNRFTATVESKNKTVASFAKASGSASGSAKEVKDTDSKFLKRKLKEPDEWKDSSGKTHKKNKMAFDACKAMSAMLWKLLDHHRDEMSQSGDEKATAKEVRLSELLSYSDLTDKLESMSVREILEFALNTVHEQSVVVYLTHHYSHDVVTAFTGDLLYMVDQSVPTQTRIDEAVKRVQKATPSAKAAIAPPGSRGKGSAAGEVGGKRKWSKAKQQQQQQQPQQQQQSSLPPGFGGSFGRTGGTIGGGSGPICYTCGLPGHIAANCPQK